MKILHVITSLRMGGAEKLIVDSVPLYHEKGLDVDVLLFDGSNTPFKSELESKGVNVYSLSSGRSVYNPSFIIKLLPYLSRYDIVHTHNTAPQLFAAIASVWRPALLCTTEHNTSNRRRSMKWYYPIDKWMYSRYKEVISISESTTKHLKEYVEIKCPVRTIPNGINVSHYAEATALKKQALGCQEDSFLLMMVAGFRHQKDQDTIIHAMKFLSSRVRLCLVGDGERISECKKLAINYGVADRVIFTGRRTDVANLLKTADVVVMSSHYEGFGLAAVEGMAAGKPVVASDVPGLGDIVRGYGILFSPGNPYDLTKCVNDLMTDRNFYNYVASKCMKRAKEYDIHKMVDGYIQVYRTMIGLF